MSEMSRLQTATEKLIAGVIDSNRASGVPDGMIASALSVMGAMFRAAQCELTGTPIEVDKSSERYQALHILCSDMINSRVLPEYTSQAADAMVAHIYDLLEVTK